MRRRIIGLATACVGLAGTALVGCGARPATAALPPSAVTATRSSRSSRPSSGATRSSQTTSPKSAWRTIQAGAVSLRIPPTWHQGKQVTLSYTSMANLAAELVPVDTYYGPIQLAHPYESKQQSVIAGQANFQLLLETRGGYLYQLTVTAPAAQRALVNQVVKTITFPPPVTVTTLVHQFNAHRSAVDGQSYTRATLGSSRWLLVFGNPATAMENYDLFHSADGGGHWALINATPFVTAPHQSPHVFPGSLGQPAMFFWTPSDGIIAEATGFSPHGLLLYRTTNAGRSWQLQELGPEGQITGATSPHITERQEVLTVSVRLKSGQLFRTTSANDGKTWHPQ